MEEKVERFLNIILKPLNSEVRKNIAEKSKGEEFEYDLIDELVDLNPDENWIYMQVDWKADDEVDWQANDIARTHGIEGTFTSSSESNGSVWKKLVEYDIWLEDKGYTFMLWDQDSDEYTGFICKLSETDSLTEISKTELITMTGLDQPALCKAESLPSLR